MAIYRNLAPDPALFSWFGVPWRDHRNQGCACEPGRAALQSIRADGIASVRTFRSILAMIESISAITLATHDMSRAVRFYRMLGFEIAYGGEDASFTSFRAGTNYLNLITQPC
jgi:hypothetical protein